MFSGIIYRLLVSRVLKRLKMGNIENGRFGGIFCRFGG